MYQKTYSFIVIVGTIICLYLYSTIYFSSLRFENNKALINSSIEMEGLVGYPRLSDQVDVNASWFSKHFIQNPDEKEQYLRLELLRGKSERDHLLEMKKVYQALLDGRPSWPYYYSGLLQIDNLLNEINGDNIDNAIKFGVHEALVAESLAEILFYKWDLLGLTIKNDMLAYLMDQSESRASGIINISAKFSRIYEYCDFIYEKKHVEYAACKGHYWQPLMKL